MRINPSAGCKGFPLYSLHTEDLKYLYLQQSLSIEHAEYCMFLAPISVWFVVWNEALGMNNNGTWTCGSNGTNCISESNLHVYGRRRGRRRRHTIFYDRKFIRLNKKKILCMYVSMMARCHIISSVSFPYKMTYKDPWNKRGNFTWQCMEQWTCFK